jgi:hypothetical protein
MDTKEEQYQQLKQALANTQYVEAAANRAKKVNGGLVENAWTMDNNGEIQRWSFDDIQALPAITSIDLSSLTSANLSAIAGAPYPNTSVQLGGSGGSGVYTTAIGGGGGGGSGQINYPNQTWTTTGTTGTSGNWQKPYNQGLGTTKITADEIEIQGKSLLATLERIEQRLGILDCDETLEQHWDELKALGDEYRKLKQHIEDKMKTFETLKKMPKPEIK